MRIISLLPAATEIAAALGLMEQVVGVSHECDFPEEANTCASAPQGSHIARVAFLWNGWIRRFVPVTGYLNWSKSRVVKIR
jgi:hypothetical protein